MNPRVIAPWPGPGQGAVEVPGSKSITNRALVAALLASGASTLTGLGEGSDTEAMQAAAVELGARCTQLDDGGIRVVGRAGRPTAPVGSVDARQGGTVGRFLVPVAALADGPVVVDAAPQLRARPMAPLLDAIIALGARVEPLGSPGHLPVRITTGSFRQGGVVRLPGDVSSQFLSALLLAGPCTDTGIRIELTTPLVSVPYVQMTARVIAAFGGRVTWQDDVLHAHGGGYAATELAVEPDASAATYPMAAAVVTGGRLLVRGLRQDSWQGDVGFTADLAAMGASVTDTADGIEVTAGSQLVAIDVDLADRSDTVPSVAAVAAFADGTTRLRGIGFIRRKESDRIATTVSMLRACGVEAVEQPDGLDVVGTAGVPPEPSGVVLTHDDHRIAMAAAVVAAGAAGPVRIDDDACVAKSFPGFWSVWDDLAERSARA